MIFIVLFVILIGVLLLFPSVQTWTAGVVSERISKELGAELRIDRVSIHPFGAIVLQGLYIEDLRGDTLIAADELHVKGLRVHPRSDLVQAGAVELRNARFALATASGDAHSNLTNLLQKLKSTDTASAGEPWTIKVGNVLIDRVHFSFTDHNKDQLAFGVDFDHVDLRSTIHGRRFFMHKDSIAVDLQTLSIADQSGFVLHTLSGASSIRPRGIDIEGMQLRTPSSDIHGKLRFQSESWADYDDFEEKVVMRLDLDTSRVEFGDIAYFAPGLEGIDLPIGIHGKIRGTVNELRGRGVAINFGRGSWFRGNADLSGLPDLPNTFMLIDVEELRTDPGDLAMLPVPPFTEGGDLKIPTEVQQLGEIRFSGNFTGFTRAFTAYGTTTTDLGELRTDLSYERDTLSNIFTLSGRAATNSLDLGPLLRTHVIGPLAANIRIKGRGHDLPGMRAELDGTFPMFTFEGRKITGITANGVLERDLFNGKLQVDDEHMMMKFEGLADLRGRWPQVDFDAQIQHLDLRALGLAPNEGYSTLSMLVNVNGRLSPDSLLGRLEAEKVSYCNDRGEHELGDIIIRSGRTQGRNVLELDADFADATITGDFLPTKIAGSVTDLLHGVFPSLRNGTRYTAAEQDLTFEIYTKHTAQMLDLFVPGMVIDSGAVITGGLNSIEKDIGLNAEVPGVRYRDIYASDLRIIVEKTMDVLAFRIESPEQVWKDSVKFIGTSITGKGYQDEMELALGWESSSSGTNGKISVVGEVLGRNSFALMLQPSQIHLGRGNWANQEVAYITIDTSTVRIDSLVLQNERQLLVIDGMISKDPEASLTVLFDGVTLENLDPFIAKPDLSGSLTGNGRVHDLYRSPVITSQLRVDSLAIDRYPIGDLLFNAGWAQGKRSIDVMGRVERDDIKALDFGGIVVLDEEKTLDLDLVMDRFDLTFIEPYLPSGLSDIQGNISGVIAVDGKLAEPQVNGEVDLVGAGLRIDYLNTLYTFDNKVMIRPDMFAMDEVTVKDEEGNTGKLGATLIHHGLKDWNFDIWGTMNGMKVLNTTLDRNELFYGTAYGFGEFSVSGYSGGMEINVDARTAEGTDIHFPIGGSTEVSDIGFINFISSDSTAEEEQAVDLSGIALDMNIEVTPDAHFELIFDPTVGDILSGRGQGNIAMGITPSGRFDMRGQVEISDGDYLFTLRNVVNKRFQLEPGGRIVWYGDPLNAQLDLEATYRVRAPLYDIMYDKNEAYRRRVPIDVVMQLRERLLNPEINFAIKLPSVDEAVRTQVNSAIATQDELNKQVFALIVLNRFVPPPNQGEAPPGSSTGSAVASTTTSELLSSQVSNWLSRLSNDFDLGVNYRPGDNITNDELEVAVSTQLFAERLLLSTNLGVAYGQQATQNSNTLIGDFQVEYLLTQDGKLRLKAFSQSNDRNLNRADQALTTQGAGLAYREEFDRFGEFIQQVLNIFRPEHKDRKFN